MPPARLRTPSFAAALFVLVALSAAPAAAQGRDPVTFRGATGNGAYLAQVRNAVEGVRQRWLAAWEADDARTLGTLVADDAIFVFGDEPARMGRAEIEADLARRLPAVTQLHQRALHFSTSGDMAYEIGSLSFLAQAPGRDGQFSHEGTYSTILRRRNDGSWQVLSFVTAERGDTTRLVRLPPPAPPAEVASASDDASPSSPSGPGGPAGGAMSAEARAVDAVVRRLSDAIRTADSTAVRDVFYPGARILSVGTVNGQPVVQAGGINEFVTSVGAPRQAQWDERLGGVEVRVEGMLASVWARYTFYAGERIAHCGVNAYQLFRGEAGWQIVQLTDTRSPAPCPEVRRR
jgi:uncharacterized protein (TIGR02246 family)